MPRKPAAPISAFDIPADAAVAEMLGEVDRRQEELRLSPAERKKLLDARRKAEARAERERARLAAQAANRMVVLLPVDLKAQLESRAAQIGCPVSEIVTFMLYEADRLFDNGAFQMESYKYPSYSPRYTIELIHPLDAERTQRRIENRRKRGWG
jgi:hypothetical protein